MSHALILAGALAFAGAAPPTAAGPPASGQVASASSNPSVKPIPVVGDKADADDPMVCQSIEVTGSMFTKRQCLHRSQWDQQARDGKDLYDGFSAGGAMIPDGPTGRH